MVSRNSDAVNSWDSTHAHKIKSNLKANPTLNFSQNGFSLISTLIALFIMGMLTSSMFGLLSIQNTEDRHLQQKLARSSLKHGILRILKNENDCSCHFKGESLQGINKLDLTFKPTCDGWDSLPQVQVGKNKNIGANLKVKSVKLQKNIRAGQLIEGRVC